MGDWNDYRSASMVGRNPERVRDAANAEIDRLRSDNERLREALLKITKSVHGSFDDAHVMADIARAALEAKDE